MYVRDFIKKLGGLTNVSLDLGLSEQAVHRWYRKGVPANRMKVLCDYCYGEGFKEFDKKFISELETEKK